MQSVVVDTPVATEYVYVALPEKLLGDDAESRVMAKLVVWVRSHDPAPASVASGFDVVVDTSVADVEHSAPDTSSLPSLCAM